MYGGYSTGHTGRTGVSHAICRTKEVEKKRRVLANKMEGHYTEMRSINKNEVTSSIPVTANQCYAANTSMDVNPAYGCHEDQETPLDHTHKEIIASEHHYAEIDKITDIEWSIHMFD